MTDFELLLGIIGLGAAAGFIGGMSHLLYRLTGRDQPGHCRKCGYDMRETPERCPECGSPPS